MRCDQPMGLPSEAVKFLHEHYKPSCCECCGSVLPDDKQKTKKVIGSYGGYDTHDLWEYILDDKRVATEFVQATIFSSGPVFFIGLRVSDGTDFLWSEKDIENC